MPPICLLRERFHRNLDLPYYLALARRSEPPVLELGGGTGRVSHALAEAGVEVVCVERDAASVAVARERAALHGGRMRVHAADALTFRAAERFSLVLGPSFFEHLDAEALATVLARVRGCLRPGGHVAVRVATRACPDRSDPWRQDAVLDDGRPVWRESWTEPGPASDVVHAHVRYHLPDGTTETETLPIHRWDVQAFRALCAGAGYRVDEQAGDFSGAPLDAGSPFALFVLAPDGI
jgi:SAM-dependent methyltransferase